MRSIEGVGKCRVIFCIEVGTKGVVETDSIGGETCVYTALLMA
jgi:hypothetical protein